MVLKMVYLILVYVVVPQAATVVLLCHENYQTACNMSS